MAFSSFSFRGFRFFSSPFLNCERFVLLPSRFRISRDSSSKTSEENSHRYSPPYFQKWHSEVLSLSLPVLPGVDEALPSASFLPGIPLPFLSNFKFRNLHETRHLPTGRTGSPLFIWIDNFPFRNCSSSFLLLGSSNLHDEIFIFFI